MKIQCYIKKTGKVFNVVQLNLDQKPQTVVVIEDNRSKCYELEDTIILDGVSDLKEITNYFEIRKELIQLRKSTEVLCNERLKDQLKTSNRQFQELINLAKIENGKSK